MDSGMTFGPFRIERELGAGGMGRVYAAVVEGVVPELPAGARVAVKVVHPSLLPDSDAAARFRREIDIGRTIRHANVVRTLGAGEVDGQHYLVMEYVEGQTLDALIAELERVPEALCRHIARELSKGLAAIHRAAMLASDPTWRRIEQEVAERGLS